MKKHSVGDLGLILCCALLLGGLFALLFLLPHDDFSEDENRSLATLRLPTVSELTDGSFSKHFSAFCTDQFPFRSRLISLKATAEQALGKRENNGILFGKDGYLIPRGEYKSLSVAEDNLTALEEFVEEAHTSGVPLSLLFVPRHVEALGELLPDGFHTSHSAEVVKRIKARQALSSSILPLDSLPGTPDAFYKTDHHWTTYGAYLAYRALGKTLGYTPYTEDFFTPTTVSEGFFGTSDSTVGGIGSSADSVVLYRYENDGRFWVKNRETGALCEGFYRFSALEQKDKYRVFLGGNYARLTVTDPERADKPHLLLIKDSYANALIPFLALHFNLTVLDLRYTAGIPEELKSLDEFDRILILQGVDTLATDGALKKLGSTSS